jgi:hypothetical protein
MVRQLRRVPPTPVSNRVRVARPEAPAAPEVSAAEAQAIHPPLGRPRPVPYRNSHRTWTTAPSRSAAERFPDWRRTQPIVKDRLLQTIPDCPPAPTVNRGRCLHHSTANRCLRQRRVMTATMGGKACSRRWELGTEYDDRPSAHRSWVFPVPQERLAPAPVSACRGYLVAGPGSPGRRQLAFRRWVPTYVDGRPRPLVVP